MSGWWWSVEEIDCSSRPAWWIESCGQRIGASTIQHDSTLWELCRAVSGRRTRRDDLRSKVNCCYFDLLHVWNRPKVCMSRFGLDFLWLTAFCIFSHELCLSFHIIYIAGMCVFWVSHLSFVWENISTQHHCVPCFMSMLLCAWCQLSHIVFQCLEDGHKIDDWFYIQNCLFGLEAIVNDSHLLISLRCILFSTLFH